MQKANRKTPKKNVGPSLIIKTFPGWYLCLNECCGRKIILLHLKSVTTKKKSIKSRLKNVSVVKKIISNGDVFWKVLGVTYNLRFLSRDPRFRHTSSSNENICPILIPKGAEHITTQNCPQVCLQRKAINWRMGRSSAKSSSKTVLNPGLCGFVACRVSPLITWKQKLCASYRGWNCLYFPALHLLNPKTPMENSRSDFCPFILAHPVTQEWSGFFSSHKTGLDMQQLPIL